MRTTTALAAGAAFLALGSWGASAGPSQPIGAQARGHAVQSVDWYCGPHCQHWRHRHWEERHWQRDGYYHQGGYDHPHRYHQYGYNHGYGY